MTNEQLDALEVAAKKMIETSCGPFASFYNEDFSKLILDLIAELRQARASLHWSRLKSLDEAIEGGAND